jgi:hypothetical protein
MNELTAIVNIIAPQLLIDSLETNYGVIQRQIRGLSHEDSLLQLPFRGNCLNWVLGHITWSRERMLKALNAPPVWDAEQKARYERDSQPVTSGDDAIRLETILETMGTQQERILAVLKNRTSEDLQAISVEIIANAPPQSIGDWLHFLIWHEAYHVGQTELLRQLTGVNDKVI